MRTRPPVGDPVGPAVGADRVAAYPRRHTAEIGGGQSMGTMEAEQQHIHKVGRGSFPCAWSPGTLTWWPGCAAGWGRGSPRTREPAMTPGRRERRERKIAWRLARLAGARTIRGEGLGVPARRLPRGLQGRRPLRGSRCPAGAVVNNSFMPTCRTFVFAICHRMECC